MYVIALALLLILAAIVIGAFLEWAQGKGWIE